MKVWFKNSDPTNVISFGKSRGEADENYFEHNGALEHGMKNEFYDITGGNRLVAKGQAVVDQIKADKQTAAKQVWTGREARLVTARGHAVNGIPSTQPGQQEAIDLLYKILEEKGILG